MNRLVFENFTIDDSFLQKGVDFGTTINTEKNLQLGVASKAYLNFTLLDLNKEKLFEIVPFLFKNNQKWSSTDGDFLKFNQAIDINELEFEWFNENEKQGDFIVYSVEKIDETKYNVKAYDKMHLFEKYVTSWYNELAYPITIKQLIAKLCAHVGVNYKIQSDTIMDFELTKTVHVSDTKAREILSWALSATMNFAYFDRTGTLIIDFYKTTGKQLTADDYKYIKISDYATAKVNKFQIRSTDDDIGVVVGTGENAYILEGNPLFFDKTLEQLQPVATALFNKIKDVSYTPCELDYFADKTKISVGEIFSVLDKQGSHQALAMSVALTGTGFLQTTSCTGNKNRNYLKSVNHVVKTLNNKTAEIKADVEQFSVKISEVETSVDNVSTIVEENYTEFTQTAERFELEVANVKENITDIEDITDPIEQAVTAAKLTFDINGLTIKNGGFKIVDNNNNPTMSVSSTGYLTLVGSITGRNLTLKNPGETTSYLSAYLGYYEGSTHPSPLFILRRSDGSAALSLFTRPNAIESSALNMISQSNVLLIDLGIVDSGNPHFSMKNTAGATVYDFFITDTGNPYNIIKNANGATVYECYSTTLGNAFINCKAANGQWQFQTSYNGTSSYVAVRNPTPSGAEVRIDVTGNNAMIAAYGTGSSFITVSPGIKTPYIALSGDSGALTYRRWYMGSDGKAYLDTSGLSCENIWYKGLAVWRDSNGYLRA